MNNVSAILSKLEPHRDRFVRRPLTSAQIEFLESEAGSRAPECVRAFLLTLGIEQDFIVVDDEIEQIFVRQSALIEAAKFVNENAKSDLILFPISHDGADGIFAVARFANNADSPIFFCDYETGDLRVVVPSFCSWLATRVERFLATITSRPTAIKKVWSVQFGFETASEDRILRTLNTVVPAHFDSEEWGPQEVKNSKVSVSRRSLIVDGVDRVLTRREFPGWPTPRFSLGFDEPAGLPDDESVIRRVIYASEAADIGFSLVDYGITRRK